MKLRDLTFQPSSYLGPSLLAEGSFVHLIFFCWNTESKGVPDIFGMVREVALEVYLTKIRWKIEIFLWSRALKQFSSFSLKLWRCRWSGLHLRKPVWGWIIRGNKVLSMGNQSDEWVIVPWNCFILSPLPVYGLIRLTYQKKLLRL